MTRTSPVVAMLVPGGFEHAGGIGRWAGYLHAVWIEAGLQPPLEVIDTRGHGHAGRAASAFAGALVRLVRLRAQGRLGLIHANLSARGSTVRKVLIGRLARILGVPLVLHLHGSGYHEFYDRLPRRLQRPVHDLFHGAAQVIVLGAFWADWVTRTLGVPAARITILPNGVPRPAPGSPRDDLPCHIVLLGRIGPRKGVPELIEALATLRDRSWRATLAGDGEVAAARAAVERAGLAPRIAVPGWLAQSDAADLLASADILALPSHAENFPISIIEALAHGVAVVATQVGATPELLEHGKSALFVPVGDPAALARALAELIDDPARRRALAQAGQRVFEAKLDIRVLARDLARLYSELQSTG